MALCRAPWLHGHRSARLNISLDDLEDRGRRRHRAVLVALIVEDQPGPTMPSAPRESPVEPVVLDEQDISDMTGVRQVRPDVGSWSTPVSRLPGLKQCHPQCLGYPFYLRSYLGGVDSIVETALPTNVGGAHRDVSGWAGSPLREGANRRYGSLVYGSVWLSDDTGTRKALSWFARRHLRGPAGIAGSDEQDLPSRNKRDPQATRAADYARSARSAS